MFRTGVIVLLLGLGLGLLLAQTPDYNSVKSEAEKYYAEGSFARSHDAYEKALQLKLSPEETRWVKFRLADTAWRAQSATQNPDTTKLDEARKQLEAMIADQTQPQDQDQIWAEVQESLGDFWWMRRDSSNWGQAWNYYESALNFWAGSQNINLARERYLAIVWKAVRAKSPEPYYQYNQNLLPLEVLENALKIAKSNTDIIYLHYLIATTLTRQGDPVLQQNIPEEFEAAIQGGKQCECHDDALYQYAQWLSNQGRPVLTEKGQWIYQRDFKKAVELYNRIVQEYSKGSTRYYDDAVNQISTITKPSISVNVSNIFLPGSEIEYYLNWRNVKQIQLSLYKVDLTRNVLFSKDSNNGNWIQQIQTSGTAPIKSWTKPVEGKEDYLPGSEKLRLDSKLPAGAYVIEAKEMNVSARELILVSDASLVLKTSSTKALAYFCSAVNGAPIPGATIQFWEQYYDGEKSVWKSTTKESGADGTILLDLTKRSNQLFVSGQLNDRQAFSIGYSYSRGESDENWRIYAFTDKPAYRPEETVRWKFIARQKINSGYSTPSNQVVEFEISDPQGSAVKTDKATLNSFGSAWGSLDLKTEMPLGEYRIQFWNQGRTKSIGNAVLFRLEEYKLPEFKVMIQTPEENGKKKIFRVGDKVEVTIQADYYFGAPVSDADVQVVVSQNQFYHPWRPPYEYPWLYEGITQPEYNYGGQEIVNKTIKTDPTGKATLIFDTPRNAQQDFIYSIEARVTDASRREILANNTVRVTRQSYYIYPRPEHNLYRPQDKVKINFKAMDANDDPVVAEGTVRLTRDYWKEIWLDPKGDEVSGEPLKKIRAEYTTFPPPPENGCSPWRPLFQGYQHDEILTRSVKTDSKGEAEFTFTPEKDGYYRAAWTSQEKGSIPIQAETTVWVATNSTTELGYRSGGVEIIIDQDTIQAGQKAPVMLSVLSPDRYVLFATETDDLDSYQVVHMTGNAKLLQIDVNEKLEPNFFLSAAMVSDQQLYTDQKQVVVPPVQHFLQVDVKPNQEQYEPQQEGTISLITRDHNGKPVAAEVALGLVDESVYYIQSDSAGDPRQFFYGQLRYSSMQTQSTFQFRSYAKLLKEQPAIQLPIGLEGGVIGGARMDREAAEELKSLGYAADAMGALQKNAAAAPVPAPAMVKTAAKDERAQNKMVVAESPAISPEGPAVQVRTDFRSTVLWQPDIMTDANGTATVKVKYPDSLTTWKATARVVSSDNRFGIGSSTTRTKLPLVVRLQAPRFFVVGDLVTISAVINNNTVAPLTLSPAIQAEGLVVSGLVINGKMVKAETSSITVPANGEGRMDWAVSVQKAGSAKIRVSGQSGKYADAMEKSYTVYEHGINKFVAKSGKMRGNDVTVQLDIPKERKPESTQLTVQVTPSMAVTMLDALPYLIDYPYGCTEQTMSRFLPAVITEKTLSDLKLAAGSETSSYNPNKSYGGIVEEYINKTHPKGKKDIGKLDDMIKAGLKRLYDFQHSDGGWGWWKEGDSDPWMTAYVVWGLSLAQDARVEVKRDALQNGVNFLEQHLVDAETQLDLQAWMLHAVSTNQKGNPSSQFAKKAFENLWKNRDQINAYSRALLAISANNMGLQEQALVLIRNLENGVQIDNKPDQSILLSGGSNSNESVLATAHWGADGFYWRWSENPVETTSTALRALLAVDPQNKLVEPVTNWLIKNRRGAQWSSTRDTAITVLALNDYLRKSGELKTQIQYEVLVNGNSIASRTITPSDMFNAPSSYDVDPKYIKDGINEIKVVKKAGDGPLYFAAQAEYFSLEEPIAAAGNELFVRRQYYKLVSHPTLLNGFVYDREPLNDGGSVKSGDRVETVLTIEAKNDYEYLVFEDLKPAGLEAAEIQSGESLYANELKAGAIQEKAKKGFNARISAEESMDTNQNFTGRTRWVYQELRDRKVALFIDKLPQGIWEIHYSMRAEVPGQFHALPATGYAMYVPEIRANGTEIRITVQDK